MTFESEPRERALEGDVDQIYSFTSTTFIPPQMQLRSVSPYSQRVGRYLNMYVVALRRSVALLSIAIHTVECLTINDCTPLLTSFPSRLVRPHENNQAPLTRTKCQIQFYTLLLLSLLPSMILELLLPVMLHRPPSRLQR
jgi:hypothetical protein